MLKGILQLVMLSLFIPLSFSRVPFIKIEHSKDNKFNSIQFKHNVGGGIPKIYMYMYVKGGSWDNDEYDQCISEDYFTLINVHYNFLAITDLCIPFST